SAGRVYINQLGYQPSAAKICFASQPSDSFFIIGASDGTRLFSGTMSLAKSGDPASGMTLYKGDFSAFQGQGRFRFVTSSGDTSYPFLIADTVYNPLFRAALKGFYYQRCGMALTPSSAGVYARAQCHTTDGFLHPSTGLSGYRETTGGWHDAGDYGKYVVNAGISVGTLLMAYELFPQQFSADNLGIPESGNGIPDILDEARYELAWLLKMQSPQGGVYFKLTREQFEGFVMPVGDNTAARYLYAISTAATGDFAAVMARAARLYIHYDSVFADTCLAVSERAWNYLTANPAIVPSGGFTNPSGTATGEYGDSQDGDERLWAAAELYETTGAQTYALYYLLNYTSLGLFASPMSWQNVSSLAHLTYLTAQRSSSDLTLRNELRSSLKTYCDMLVTNRNGDGFHCVIPPGQYYWGSNSQALNSAILLLVAGSLHIDSAYSSIALEQLHYIAGRNVNNICYVTGLGSVSPMHPHHRPSESDGNIAPVPGLLAGGPDQYLDDSVLKSLYTLATPPAQCYSDQLGSYASNEIAINWNAPLVFVAGFFASPSTPTHSEKPQGMSPSGYRLDQCFPNPFNPSTTIRYALPSSAVVRLLVFDLLGRRIRTLFEGQATAGEHSAVWNGLDDNGETVASSVYFYQLRTGTKVIETRKTILLR
ncbi:MAG TPA: glycoside hydrolase family 9 protein, partial [Bacteroidota bacterium]